MVYANIAIGGTFDKLHRGHERLLGHAFTLGEEVYIGLVDSEDLLKDKKLREKIDPYDVRREALESYLHFKGWYVRAHIFPLYDRYGVALESCIDALILTPNNIVVGEEINKKRSETYLKELALIEISLALAEDGEIMSSTRIRSGEIDRDGRLVK